MAMWQDRRLTERLMWVQFKLNKWKKVYASLVNSYFIITEVRNDVKDQNDNINPNFHYVSLSHQRHWMAPRSSVGFNIMVDKFLFAHSL